MTLCSDERTLYINNLDKNVTDDILYELFLQAGPVERVNIVTSNISSSNYGFVTYKHEVSIDYAIQLYKDTCLFNKELLIKKKGKNDSNKQVNDYNHHGVFEPFETYSKRNIITKPITKESMHNGPQSFRLNDDEPNVLNFKSNLLEGNHGRNKPYDHSSRLHSSRLHLHDDRRRHKNKNFSNKTYYCKSRWY